MISMGAIRNLGNGGRTVCGRRESEWSIRPFPAPGSAWHFQPARSTHAGRRPATGPRSPGIFGAGVIVLEGSDEFVVDFLQGLNRPPRVATRVVMSPNVMSQFANALRENLQKFERAFGPPEPAHAQCGTSSQRAGHLPGTFAPLPDEMLSGCYANTVMIGHSPSEFFFDFITRFYPTAAVSARVYLAASQVPPMLSALTTSLEPGEPRGGGQEGTLRPTRVEVRQAASLVLTA